MMDEHLTLTPKLDSMIIFFLLRLECSSMSQDRFFPLSLSSLFL